MTLACSRRWLTTVGVGCLIALSVSTGNLYAAGAPRIQTDALVDGTVTDTMMQPLADAEIAVAGTNSRVTSDANGRFRFLQVPVGVHVLTVRRVGYAPVTSVVNLRDNDTLRLTFTLTRTTGMLDTVQVRSILPNWRLSEFEARRRQGVGQFITQNEIDRRGPVYAADLLRRLSGIRLTPSTGGLLALSAREGGSVGGAGAGICEMQVLIDGRAMPQRFDLSQLPPPTEIAGIELYKGPATAPFELGGPNRRCGVIAVWTRGGE